MRLRRRLYTAFDRDQRVKVLARKYHQHPKTVSRNREALAGCFLEAQTRWLWACRASCEAREPLCVSVGRAMTRYDRELASHVWGALCTDSG